MKKAIKFAVLVLIAAVMFVATAFVGQNAEYTDANVQSLEQQIANVQWQIEQAKQELEQIRNQESDAWTQISKYDEIIKYNDDLKKLAEEQLNSITDQIKNTKAQIDDVQGRIDKQFSAFLERMAQTQTEQKVDYLSLILGSENLFDLMTRWDRVSAIMEYDNNVIDQLEKDKAELEILEQRLSDSETIQIDRVSTYENVIKENKAAYDEKLELLNSLYSDEATAASTYEYYSQLNNELNAELEEYLAELQRRSQSQYVGGVGGWPLEPGVYYYVSSEWGWRDLWGYPDKHYGIDLACAADTPIYSYNAGTVLRAQFHYSYGNYVLVDHGGGISTLYAHMRESVVQEGEYVQAGQLLGYVGLTGNTSGYHLHFEVRINGEDVDPRGYLYFP